MISNLLRCVTLLAYPVPLDQPGVQAQFLTETDHHHMLLPSLLVLSQGGCLDWFPTARVILTRPTPGSAGALPFSQLTHLTRAFARPPNPLTAKAVISPGRALYPSEHRPNYSFQACSFCFRSGARGWSHRGHRASTSPSIQHRIIAGARSREPGNNRVQGPSPCLTLLKSICYSRQIRIYTHS